MICRDLEKIFEYECINFQELHTRKIVSKENTKCDAFRFYVVKSHNSFSLGVNNYRLFTLKEPFLIFLKLLIWKKKTHHQSSNLWNIIREMPYTFKCSPYHFFNFV